MTLLQDDIDSRSASVPDGARSERQQRRVLRCVCVAVILLGTGLSLLGPNLCRKASRD